MHSLVLSLFIRLSIHSHSFLHLPLCSFVWYCVFHFFARSVRSFDYSFGRSIVRSLFIRLLVQSVNQSVTYHLFRCVYLYLFSWFNGILYRNLALIGKMHVHTSTTLNILHSKTKRMKSHRCLKNCADPFQWREETNHREK